jgi:hypothetical protein
MKWFAVPSTAGNPGVIGRFVGLLFKMGVIREMKLQLMYDIKGKPVPMMGIR